MYTMSPEDRLRLVMRQQNDLREGMARERLAAATAKSAAAGPTSSRSRRAAVLRLGAAALHLLNAVKGGHAVAPRGVTH